jgi:GH25 family lysozyme M1 (1,4-beta-N-acetylmuramidase)
MLRGIDISNWQDGFPLSRAASMMDFVILKASEYGWKKDPQFDGFAKQADATGLRLGAYMFARDLRHGSIANQVAFFVKSCGGYLDRAVLVLDWEDTSYSQVQGNPALCRQFLDEIRRITGKTPMLYTSQSEVRYNDYSGGKHAGYPLWGACYLNRNAGGDGFIDPALPSGGWGTYGDRPSIYQYSSTGRLLGWQLDMNVAYMTKAEWDALAGGKTPEPPKPDDKLDIDGWIGPITIRKWQSQLGSPYVDGILSGQYRPNWIYYPRISGDALEFDDGSGLSEAVKRLQRKVGATPDGVLGRDSVRAIQKKLDAWGYDIGPDGADGYLGDRTARAIQRSLNDQKWK